MYMQDIQPGKVCSRLACASGTWLHTRNHSMKEIEQKSKKQRELLIQSV